MASIIDTDTVSTLEGASSTASTVTSTVTSVQDTLTSAASTVSSTTSAYSAKTSSNSATVSSMTSEGSYSNINLNNFIIPYDNVLLQYHNPTWNFSLYTMPYSEYELLWMNPTEEVSKYIVAQTGVTGRYSINSVKMTTAGPATPGITSNFSVNNFTMEITENGGMGLYDDLVVLSNTLGYKKFMDVPMILELNFIGFDQDTGVPMIIPGLNKKWGVRINSITGTASQSGGTITYTLQMTSNRAGVVENKDWTMLEPYTCTSSTFGDFLQQIEDKLNEMAQQQYGYLALKYPVFSNGKFFEIHVSDELSNLIINYDSKQSPEVGTTSSGNSGAKQFSWDAKTPFSRAIDDVLDCCVPLAGDDRKRQFVNIIPVTRYVGPDDIRNTSAFKNDFYIVKYKVGDVSHVDDLDDEKFNVEYFINNAEKFTDPDSDTPKLNIKRYDYQFSGLNNEIINLDLKFDQGFQLAIIRNPSTQTDYTNQRGTHAAAIIEYGDSTYNTASKTDVAKMWAVSSDLKKKQSEGTELTDEQQQFIYESESAAAEQQGVVEGQSDQESLSLTASATQYIEDFRNVYDMSVEGTNGIGSPRVDSIPVEPSNINTANSGALNDPSSDDELQRRLVRDNYYNRSFMAKLDMKVVGDPYWLGWGDYSYLEYLDTAVQGQDISPSTTDLNFANYITSEAYLLLNLKPIAAISDSTGLIEINQSSVFAQTLYRVNKVVSEFSSSGKFTQSITGGIVIRSLRHKDQYTDNTESEVE